MLCPVAYGLCSSQTALHFFTAAHRLTSSSLYWSLLAHPKLISLQHLPPRPAPCSPDSGSACPAPQPASERQGWVSPLLRAGPRVPGVRAPHCQLSQKERSLDEREFKPSLRWRLGIICGFPLIVLFPPPPQLIQI